MTNYQQLYWLTRLDAIIGVSTFFSITLFIVTATIIIWYFISIDMDEFYYRENEIAARKLFRGKMMRNLFWTMPLAFVFTLAAILTPNKKDMIFIYSGGKTMDFVESDTSINKIPAQTTKLITDYLEEKIKESNK